MCPSGRQLEYQKTSTNSLAKKIFKAAHHRPLPQSCRQSSRVGSPERLAFKLSASETTSNNSANNRSNANRRSYIVHPPNSSNDHMTFQKLL
jgi:hypothetical protein